MPPEPTEATTSPGWIPGRFTECRAIEAVSQSAAVSNGMSAGMRKTLLIVWTTYSA